MSFILRKVLILPNCWDVLSILHLGVCYVMVAELVLILRDWCILLWLMFSVPKIQHFHLLPWIARVRKTAMNSTCAYDVSVLELAMS